MYIGTRGHHIQDTLYLCTLMSSAEWGHFLGCGWWAQCISVRTGGIGRLVLERWEAYGAEYGAVPGRAREPGGAMGCAIRLVVGGRCGGVGVVLQQGWY